MASVSRPRGVSAEDWQNLLIALTEYRDRDRDGDVIGFEANEAAQTITEMCIRLFLPEPGANIGVCQCSSFPMAGGVDRLPKPCAGRSPDLAGSGPGQTCEIGDTHGFPR